MAPDLPSLRAPGLTCALNGRREAGSHPGLPVTPEQLAASWQAAAHAGADSAHVHPRDRHGRESLASADVGGAVLALRAAVADRQLGVTTGAWILPALEDRLSAIAAWAILPDFASVNVCEHGAHRVAAALAERGIAVEAGVWTPADAAVIAADPLPGTAWILMEPMDPGGPGALATTGATVAVLVRHQVSVPVVLHGQGAATWDVIDEAIRHGYGTRVGLEDTLALPDGATASGNADLVAAAAARGACGSR